MSSSISVLPPDLASQIAAGEVVERPSSVVKELIENSLDAGAQRIDVTIAGGGVGLIEVADDGHGMSGQNAPLSLARHATSKLRRFSDLEQLDSYGFRGEALPSVASVSRLEMRTRETNSESGVVLRAEGTSNTSPEPIGHPVGTTVSVKDLFYNVPARRKFLRSSNTESGHVADVLIEAALANPQVSFTLTRDGRAYRKLPRVTTRRQRAEQIFGDLELWEVRGEKGPLQLEGYLSSPERSRQGAGGLKLLVNGRPVKDRALSGTIAHAFGSRLEKGRYPRGVIYLDLPSRLVDVNVHPQKAEVRFADIRAVGDAVHRMISREVTRQFASAHGHGHESAPLEPRKSFVPAALPRSRESSWGPSARVLRDSDARPGAVMNGAVMNGAVMNEAATNEAVMNHTVTNNGPSSPDAVESTVSTKSWKNLRFIAQIRQTYLVCEGPDGIYILDQHAADERVLFTRLKKAYLSKKVSAQALLFPLVVDLSLEEARILDQHAEQISALGLDVRKRSDDAATIHAIPKLLQRGSPERMLRDLLGELAVSQEKGFSQSVDKALSMMACHEAVRAGDRLSPKEAEALLCSLDQADFDADCAHGRPVVAITSFRDLERKVGRR